MKTQILSLKAWGAVFAALVFMAFGVGSGRRR